MDVLITRSAKENAMQRVRVGLTGLACVFLLVMLATAFLGADRDRSSGDLTNGANTNIEAPNEPLAQLGVAPGNTPPPESTPPTRPAHH
jgi:hypothetical protein